MVYADILEDYSLEQKQSSCEVIQFSDHLLHSKLKIEFHDSLHNLEKEWLLLEKKVQFSPFQSFSWIKSLYQSSNAATPGDRPSTIRPFIVSGRVNEKLAFILPLMLETDRFGKRIKWLGAESSDYNGFKVDPDIVSQMPDDLFAQIIEQINKFVPDLDVIYLSRIPAFDNSMQRSIGASMTGWNAEYASHQLELSSDWKSLYDKIRSSKSRQRLRSKYRALKKSGRITFKQIRNVQKCADAARQILEWKAGNLIARGCRNPFGSENLPTQTRVTIEASVAETAAASLKVYGIYKNDELVAGMLAFVDAHTFYYLVSAYSPDIPGKFSIGTQLLVKTLELASRSGIQRYDFLIGDEAYKFDWCDTTVPLVNYIMPFTLKGRLYTAGIRMGQWARTFIRQSPKLSKIVRQVIKASKNEFQIHSVGKQLSINKAAQKTENLHSGCDVLRSDSLIKEAV